MSAAVVSLRRTERGALYRCGATHQRARYSDAMIEAVRALSDRGLSQANISRLLAMPRRTVRDIQSYRVRAGVDHVQRRAGARPPALLPDVEVNWVLAEHLLAAQPAKRARPERRPETPSSMSGSPLDDVVRAWRAL
jgi:hypothetical protein